MSQFADAIARLTIDKDFARATRREPDRVAVLYGLSPDEATRLRELADAAVNDRAAALQALLSVPATVLPLSEEPTLGIPLSTPTLLNVPLNRFPL